MKRPACDAGTALRLFWINDPVYYSQYATISECPYEEEQDAGEVKLKDVEYKVM